MDLKGAKIRNILNLCNDNIQSEKDAPLRVKIPCYQRPYKWDEDRVQNLIHDFYKNKIEQNDNIEYFVGSVVLVCNSDGRMEIVDGQQRVTTVFLLNFIRFLLLRAQVENLIYRKKQITISEKYKDLIECYKNLIGSDKRGQELEEHHNNLINDIEGLDDIDDAEKEKKWDIFLEDYRRVTGLPSGKEGIEDVGNQAYFDALDKFFETEDLAINYQRQPYNDSLKKALACLKITAFNDTAPNLEINKNLAQEDIDKTRKYLEAINSAFDALCDEVEKGSNIEEALISAINDIINNLQFCVVVTGNEKDAYVLFEVLNDRAMAVDDLELIKNLFYKTYCSNSKKDNDSTIDRVIEKEDTRWGDIFTPDKSTKRARRISYYAAVYLSGSTEITFSGSDRFRETIERYYLTKIQNYSSEQLKYDIDVYEMIGELLEDFKIVERSTCDSALGSQNDPSLSITCKALHLFQALGQDGVSAALINIIIKTYRNRHDKQKGNTIDDFREYIESLKGVKSENGDNPDQKLINDWARKLWRASLLAEDHRIPRDISCKIIENVSEFNDRLDSCAVSDDQESKLQTQFINWTDGYRHNKNSRDDTKVKILFHELLGTALNDGSLCKKDSQLCFKADQLQLDHLEAATPDANCPEFYYTPSSAGIIRSDVVNGLGNMMLIDLKTNVKMRNKSISDRLTEDYEDQLQGCWLLEETKELLKKYSKKIKVSDGKKRKIPTDDFFVERKKLLQKYFLEAIS